MSEDRAMSDLIDRHDAVSYIDSMAWSRVFPAEPVPSTRDLTVFAAALGAAKRRLALIDRQDCGDHYIRGYETGVAAPRAATEPRTELAAFVAGRRSGEEEWPVATEPVLTRERLSAALHECGLGRTDSGFYDVVPDRILDKLLKALTTQGET